MARLKRDERACPLCGETIKAVAVRCRYCHADVEPLAIPDPAAQNRPKIQRTLPGRAEAEPKSEVDSASTLESENEPETDLGSESDAAETDEKSTRPALTVQTVGAALGKNLTVVLAVLVLIAGIGVGVSWWRADQPSAVAPNGALVGDEARTQVLVEAADLATRALSYNYKTLDNDMEVARARMTPGFQKEYDATMAQVRDNTVKNKKIEGPTTSQGSPRSASLRPLAIMLPQVGVSMFGGMPAPRIDRLPSTINATATPSKVIDIIAGTTFGKISRMRIRGVLAPMVFAAMTNSRSDHVSVEARVIRPRMGTDTMPMAKVTVTVLRRSLVSSVPARTANSVSAKTICGIANMMLKLLVISASMRPRK